VKTDVVPSLEDETGAIGGGETEEGGREGTRTEGADTDVGETVSGGRGDKPGVLLGPAGGTRGDVDIGSGTVVGVGVGVGGDGGGDTEEV